MKIENPDIKENFPLKDFTTFKIGGPARYFTVIHNENEARGARAFAKERNMPLFVLGGGSNILLSDEGFPGLVALNRISGFESRIDGDSVYVTAGAGESWDVLVQRCVENSWQGLECLSGVPGTVGAAPVQNIGAYGQSVDTAVTEVHALDMHSGETVLFSSTECAFGYRKSIFNTTSSGRHLITSVTFRLAKGGVPAITYHDLKNCLSGMDKVTPAGVREAVLSIRNTKGLLVLEKYDVFKSAGSFFKNPVVSAEQLEDVAKAVRESGGCTNWAWPQPSGETKISAACLIQCAGFTRGCRQGNAGLSPRHTLILINHQDATAQEIISFARHIQERVHEKFGVTLRPEVQLIGFTSPHSLL